MEKDNKHQENSTLPPTVVVNTACDSREQSSNQGIIAIDNTRSKILRYNEEILYSNKETSHSNEELV